MDDAAGVFEFVGVEVCGFDGGVFGVSGLGVGALGHPWAFGFGGVLLFFFLGAFLFFIFLVWIGRSFRGFCLWVFWVDLFFSLVRSMRFRFWTWQSASYDVGEPVAETAWGGIDGGVGAVDGDAFEGEAEEGLLLRVC